MKVLTLNVKGLEKDQALPLHPHMVWRALFGLFYGDLLLFLTHQTRPWEAVPGAAEACRVQWTARLAEELKTGRGLTLGRMRQVFAQAAADFAKIPLKPGPGGGWPWWGSCTPSTAPWATGTWWPSWRGRAGRWR